MMQKQTIAALGRDIRLWCAAGATVFAALSPQQGRAAEAVFNVSNPYADVDWSTFGTYKGNLHTHTTQSDGVQAPSAVIDGYKAQNYDFLALTDHNLVTYPWTTYGRDPLVVGMTDIQGNELSSGHHIVSLFSGYASTSADAGVLLTGVANAGGLSFFAHPGRYSYNAQWYADYYLAQPSCVGMEIYNQGDRYTGDRVKWDAVLSILMPGRPVWGFSNDDSHQASHIGLNRTYLLAPSVSHANVRTALEQGSFFAAYSTSSAHVPPMLTGVTVDEAAGTITVAGTGYTQVRWISQGTQVATGETIDLVNTPGVAKYVRAELHGTQGISYSNPFGLLPTGNQPPVVSAGSDQAITLPAVATLNGTASDDDLPNPPAALTLLWEKVSGQGTVTLADDSAAQTTATFSEPGTYVLRLIANDGALSASDEVTVTVNAAGGPAGWTAYNDCSWKSGQLNTRITTYGLNQSGAMVDHATGAALPVSLQIVNNPAAPANADGTGGPMPNSGTDAYDTFNGKVSFANVIWYGNSGWWVDAVFTGLDPNRRYEFATSVNRGNASYTDRWSKFTLSGIDTATQDSTTGVQVNSDTSVSFWVGNNSANGYVARWTEIRPGSDGSFTVRAEADGQFGHNTRSAYAFDGILLRDLGPAGGEPVNQAPVVEAGSNQTITLPADATLDGSASDDGLPNPPAALTLLWEKVSGQGTVTFANDAAAQTTASFSEAGTYVLRLTANDGEMSTSAQVTITVLASLPGISFGPSGTGTRTFDSLPPANEWATAAISTGKDGFTTAAGLDAGVNALNQSAVAETLVSDTSSNPTKRNRAVWTSGGGKFIQISATSVGAVLLKSTLVNDSGAPISSLRLSYDYTVVETSAEEVPGLRAFYSQTGAPGSWTPIPAFSGLLASQALEATLTFGSPWQSGTQLFLLWADDNSAADTERKYRIDNFAATPAGLPLSMSLTAPSDAASFAKNQDVIVAASVAGGTAPFTVRFFASLDGGAAQQVGADVTSAPYQLNLGPLAPGGYVFHAEASDTAGGSAASETRSVTVTDTLGTVTNTLIAARSSWKYLDDGSDQGTAWSAPAFDDSAWAQGAAPLGYGDAWIATTVYSPAAPDRFITTYFRKTIEIADVHDITALNLGCQRDDGVVVYLNGTEVWRSNMPEGPINYLTWSSSVVSGGDETTFFPGAIPASLLVEGTNTVAVELHQRDGTSSDLTFDLWLEAERHGVIVNQPPVVSAGAGQTITLPADATLNGSASDDGQPNPPAALTLLWEKVSGEGSVTFADAASAQTTATFSEAGTYVLRLSASDGELSTSAEVTLTVRPVPQPTGWTAYNDCSPGSGQLTQNITTYGLDQSGALVDFATGSPVSAQLQIVNGGAIANGTGGPMPDAGTDAYATFNGKVSFANVAYYGAQGWYVEAVVSGLDPAKSYEFATSCNRGSSSYTDRWSKFTISGVDEAEQASTAGVQVNSETSVSFWSGDNTANGHVARWTEIRPGSDGSFTVRVEADAGHNVQRGYAFDGILLRELDADPAPLVNVANPYADVDWATFDTFKGNLHTHTTQSDGNQAPSAVIDGYKAQGYDFLAITDHDTVTYPWSTYGRDPLVVGMTDIQGNELSQGHHIVSLFCGYASSSSDAGTLLAGVANAGGISFFAHPGRYAYSAQWYADYYTAQPSCIGMEVYNQGDRYTGDRVKWDAVLSILMPQRPVWGFSNDDSHQAAHIGRNRTYLLAPSVSQSDVRSALEQGAFFATYSTSSAHVPPMLTNVVVDAANGTITVAGKGYTQVRWISQGTQVATGETLDLVNTPGVAKYVRAELHGAEGIGYTNPFGLLPTGNQPPTVSAGDDQTITLPADATLAGSASDDGLPNPPAALTLLWEKVSGQGTVTFANDAAAQTTATFSEAGTYVLRLTANDGALSASAEVTVTVEPAPAQEPSAWVAYNDCVFQDAAYKHANATVYNIGSGSPGPANGALRDLASGTVLPVTVTLTQSGGVVWQPDPVTGGSDCAAGSDADQTFGGIANMGGVIYYGSAGWTVDATFTGLDPDGVYEFATSANRNNASYPNRRSVYTLLGADTFHAASTAGVAVDGASAIFNTGDNTSNGYVARWIGIRPGADGSFSVRATHAADAESGNKAYAFDVFLLRKSDGFAAWAQQQGFRGLSTEFGEPNGNGIPRGLEFALGDNLVPGEPLLDIQIRNGRPIVDIPAQLSSTMPYVRVVLKGCTNLAAEASEWTLVTQPAADTDGKPAHREWLEPETSPERAFFKLEAERID